jgi:hypothetical protein
MMSKSSTNNSDTERHQMAEPTKYIVRCCEMRKRREGRQAGVVSRPAAHSCWQRGLEMPNDRLWDFSESQLKEIA